MSAGFTPGPWLIMRQTVYALDESGTTNRFSVRPEGGWKDNGVTYTDEEEVAANARLIAAAPDLYAALDELYGKAICGTDEERHDALNDAWAALAKARGEA